MNVTEKAKQLTDLHLELNELFVCHMRKFFEQHEDVAEYGLQSDDADFKHASLDFRFKDGEIVVYLNISVEDWGVFTLKQSFTEEQIQEFLHG